MVNRIKNIFYKILNREKTKSQYTLNKKVFNVESIYNGETSIEEAFGRIIESEMK